MRISDWSSDVCSSDLRLPESPRAGFHHSPRDPERPPLPGKNSLPGFERHAPHRAALGTLVPAPLSSSCSCKDVCVAKTAEQRRRFLHCPPMSGLVVKPARPNSLNAPFKTHEETM